MIRSISQSLLRSFPFSVHNKTQNFFDMNPIYPDSGDKNFDIYNSERKKINVVDQFLNQEAQVARKRRMVRQRIFAPKYEKFRRYSGGTSLVIDKSTDLPLGMDSDFDDFVAKYKRDLYVDQTAKSEFKETLIKLIYRFKCKSQAELIRLFRISVANSKKKGLLDKIRGQLMQDAILKTAQHFTYPPPSENPENQQEQAFEMALKQIDQKISKAEQALRYDKFGIPIALSNYDRKYGWMETKEYKENKEFDLNVPIKERVAVEMSSGPDSDNLQDWSIKTRINRLYFLRRLEYLKKSQQDFKDITFHQELPQNIRNRDKIMNQLAHKYKEAELLQQPDLEEIYREIDAMVDKVNVKISSGGQTKNKRDNVEEVYDKAPEVREYLWENIQAEEILCDTMYAPDSNKDIVLTDQYLRQYSPSAHTELTLTKIPMNLYRHSQLEIFGIYNEYRKKLAGNLLKVQEMDFEPQFQEFSLQSAKRRYRKMEVQVAEKGKTATGKARRKTAYAEAFIKDGTGVVTINGEPIQDYYGDTYFRVEALKPLVITDSSGLYDVAIRAFGSGSQGQSQAMAYALARALMKINPEHKRVLAGFGLVGFDFRKKEAKKTNLYSARVRPPYVRR